MRKPAFLGILFGLAVAGCSSQPAVAKVMPDVGSVGGGDDIAIEGRGFEPGLTVMFGRKPAKVGSLKPDRIELKSPPSNQIGPVDIVLTFADGRTLVAKNAFKYQESKTIEETK